MISANFAVMFSKGKISVRSRKTNYFFQFFGNEISQRFLDFASDFSEISRFFQLFFNWRWHHLASELSGHVCTPSDAAMRGTRACEFHRLWFTSTGVPLAYVYRYMCMCVCLFVCLCVCVCHAFSRNTRQTQENTLES